MWYGAAMTNYDLLFALGMICVIATIAGGGFIFYKLSMRRYERDNPPRSYEEIARLSELRREARRAYAIDERIEQWKSMA